MQSTSEFDRMVNELASMGVPRDRAEMAARLRLGAPAYVSVTVPDERLEKLVEAAGDRLMREHGFEVVRFSHPGKTKQTPGIPDRRYYRRPKIVDRPDGRFLAPALVVWVEYKSASGRQRPGQQLFQEMAEACGEAYVLGGLSELQTWLQSHA